jgi:hypothetical protein
MVVRADEYAVQQMALSQNRKWLAGVEATIEQQGELIRVLKEDLTLARSVVPMAGVDPFPYEPSDVEEDVAPGGADPLVSNPAKELEDARSDNMRLKTELSVLR